MQIRTNTIELSNVLEQCGIDLDLELSASQYVKPTVTDFYAVLMASRTLLSYGISIPDLKFDENGLELTQMFEFTGSRDITMGIELLFDLEFRLINTSVVIDVLRSEKKQNHVKHVWESVDLTCMVGLLSLVGEFTNRMFQFIFNDEYSTDYINMLVRDMQAPSINRAIAINGQPYTVLLKDQTNHIDTGTGIVDLFLVQGMALSHHESDIRNIDFQYDEPTGLLGIDTD